MAIVGKIDMHKIFICLFAIYFLLTPFGVMTIEGFGSGLKFYMFLLLPITLIAINVEKIKITGICFWQLMLVLLGIISMSYTVNTELSIQFIVTQFLFLVLLFLSSNVKYSVRDLDIIKEAVVWSSRIAVGLILILGERIQERLILRSFFAEDPNYFNGYMLFGLINATDKIFSNISKKQKIIPAFEILIYLYLSFLTGSRGGLLALIMSVVFFIVFRFFSQKHNLKIIIYYFSKVLAIGILLCVFGILTLNSIDSSLAERFYWTNILESNGTGRVDIWNAAIAMYFNSDICEMLFGYGAGAFKSAINAYEISIFLVAHNVFLQILIELGIIGFISYIGLILCVLINAVKMKDIFIASVFIGFIVMSLSLSIFSLKPYWNTILYCNIAFISFKKYKMY